MKPSQGSKPTKKLKKDEIAAMATADDSEDEGQRTSARSKSCSNLNPILIDYGPGNIKHLPISFILKSSKIIFWIF